LPSTLHSITALRLLNASAALDELIKDSIPQNRTEKNTTKAMMNLTILVTPYKNKINLMNVDDVITWIQSRGQIPDYTPLHKKP
jgi:hypothetical protein